MQSPVKKERKKNPKEKANIFSSLTYLWVFDIFWTGYKRDLEIDDLPEALKEHKSNYLGEKLSASWEKELRQVKNNNSKPNLFKVLWNVFGLEFISLGIFFSASLIIIRTTQPLALAEFVKYFSIKENSGSGVNKNDAYMYAGGVIICTLMNTFALRGFIMIMNHLGMKIRVACCSLIYRKVLRLSPASMDGKIIGQSVNLMSNDVSRFDAYIMYLHFIWMGPLQTIIVSYFIYRETGWSGIIGVVCFLIAIPLISWIGKKSTSYRRKSAEKTDERVRLTNAIINGIEAIKMYSWEYPFSNLIKNSRDTEIKAIQSAYNLRVIILSLAQFLSKVIGFITILCIIFIEFDDVRDKNKLTAAKVFMLIAYFEMIRPVMLVSFPKGILLLAEIIASIKRIQDFMMYEEIDIATQLRPLKSLSNKNIKEFNSKKIDGCYFNINEGSIKIENVYAKWIKEDTLSGINMQVDPGQLVAIVGPIGSGKSSLLNVILKELAVYQGSVDVQGNIAYACQEPWLFAGSVRNNILFGRAFDQKRYERVVKVCQLKRDYQLFPYGDKTIVGDRGVSLSGGQRARINLARAVYADAPIYLFDDPLSAVDAHVGKHMFEECIEKYLKGKTRILVTHQIQFLRNVDKIIVMKEGKIEAKGSYDDLISRGIDFGTLSTPLSLESGKKSLALSQTSLLQYSSSSSLNLESSTPEDNNTINDNEKVPVVVEENQNRRRMEAKRYLAYFGAAGSSCLVCLTFLLLVLAQIFLSGGDWFIAYWIKIEEKYPNSTLTESEKSERSLSTFDCINILTIITVSMIVLIFAGSFVFISVCMRSSRRLHNRIFKSITHATMRFFNTNPSGRILNCFSKDLGTVDELLPVSMLECIQNIVKVIGILILLSMKNISLVVPAIFIALITSLMRSFYLRTLRSIKKLEGITKSPVFNHLSATYQGLATIRSSNSQKILIQEFDNHQDLHSSAWYMYIATSSAFVSWLDMFCSIYVCIVTMSLLLFDDNEKVSGSNIGLIITQTIILTGMFQFIMSQLTILENNMTSVERVCEYTNLESEPPLESLPDKKPKEEWPESGNIKFKNVNMSYDPDEAPVLKNLNFTIGAKEKVGIVGRTGAGKSSLISALFRLAYIDGKIEIDGIDTGEIGLHDLRSKISIIPQEPFLFTGTLRRNLDPFDSSSDHTLWSALEDVELKEMFLNDHVSEGGSNLSVGQRQLVCLARAIIRNNRVLILDEATANVDPRTDELIQKTIRRKFADCTVLTIAHRLNTVMDSDKILVMDAGTVVEFDHPHVLLQNPDGALSSMLKNSGNDMATAFRTKITLN
ncbi:hypothetical protein HCN44_002333 [Aphidius gifuensis]|uniref:Uncharacterized protein n=2 Tax=Aphidius gifuensis TaxID=684658 RepID=A0A834Y2X6_APHGI|nr:hypothetical protein HCN44_002333 [Aphidius gifuensis]